MKCGRDNCENEVKRSRQGYWNTYCGKDCVRKNTQWMPQRIMPKEVLAIKKTEVIK